MRYLITPELANKLKALRESEQSLFADVIHYLADEEKDSIFAKGSKYTVNLLKENIYVLTAGNIQLYLTRDSDEQGEFLILLDFTVESEYRTQPNFFAIKNPRKNRSLNPIYNHRINPTYNHSLNPIYNHRINPIYNHRINPIYNHRINPIYNHRINPIYNHRINPIYNHRINPIYNRRINPQFNRSFGGPFIYSRNLEQEYFLIRATETIHILFDMSVQFAGIVVEHPPDFNVVFDANNTWTGYLVSANNDIWLRFDTNGNWTGIAV